MQSLNTLKSVINSVEELMADLNRIVADKVSIDPSLVFASQATEQVFDYADDFNYLSFTVVPVDDAINLHIEFGLCGGDERLLSGGAVLNWSFKQREVYDYELLHIRGNAVSLAIFIEELTKHIGLPAVA